MFVVQLKAEQMLPFRAAFLSFLHNFICFARPPETSHQTRSRKREKWERTTERERERGVGCRGRLPQIVNKHINMQHEIGLMSINRRADGQTDRQRETGRCHRNPFQRVADQNGLSSPQSSIIESKKNTLRKK